MVPDSLWETLTIRYRQGPIESVEELVEFVGTRSAYVAQTSLYGYVKNRMGIKYPEMFADKTMALSINLAKWRTYGSCLGDLSVFSAASSGTGGLLQNKDMAALARHCFDTTVTGSFDDEEAEGLKNEIIKTFNARLKDVEWESAAEGENAFLHSPVDLIKFAPIADELKELDVDIVVNSTRFRWRDIRQQLRKRIDAAAVSKDWLDTGGT